MSSFRGITVPSIALERLLDRVRCFKGDYGTQCCGVLDRVRPVREITVRSAARCQGDYGGNCAILQILRYRVRGFKRDYGTECPPSRRLRGTCAVLERLR